MLVELLNAPHLQVFGFQRAKLLAKDGLPRPVWLRGLDGSLPAFVASELLFFLIVLAFSFIAQLFFTVARYICRSLVADVTLFLDARVLGFGCILLLDVPALPAQHQFLPSFR